MPHWKTASLILFLAVAGWMLTMYILSALAYKPSDLGAKGGKLAECPGTPNCVCSQASDNHAIDPLAFEGDATEAWEKLRAIVASRARTQIKTQTDSYLHAEATSLVFRFVDDVEFLLDRDAKLIHVRSASRAGRSDFGVNRHRVEQIRQAFAAE